LVARSTEARRTAAIVAILVDGSRSMGLADVDGGRRIDTVKSLVTAQLLPALTPRSHTERLRSGERMTAVEPSRLSAADRRTELGAALNAVRDRYRGRPLAAVV